MKLAVTGSREFINTDKIVRELDAINKILQTKGDSIEHLISGGALGVDTCVQEYAKLRSIPITIFYPSKKSATKSLYKILKADKVVVFLDSNCTHSKLMVYEAERLDKLLAAIVV
jgi:hypothetical protein